MKDLALYFVTHPAWAIAFVLMIVCYIQVWAHLNYLSHYESTWEQNERVLNFQKTQIERQEKDQQALESFVDNLADQVQLKVEKRLREKRRPLPSTIEDSKKIINESTEG